MFLKIHQNFEIQSSLVECKRRWNKGTRFCQTEMRGDLEQDSNLFAHLHLLGVGYMICLPYVFMVVGYTGKFGIDSPGNKQKCTTWKDSSLESDED